MARKSNKKRKDKGRVEDSLLANDKGNKENEKASIKTSPKKSSTKYVHQDQLNSTTVKQTSPPTTLNQILMKSLEETKKSSMVSKSDKKNVSNSSSKGNTMLPRNVQPNLPYSKKACKTFLNLNKHFQTNNISDVLPMSSHQSTANNPCNKNQNIDVVKTGEYNDNLLRTAIGGWINFSDQACEEMTKHIHQKIIARLREPSVRGKILIDCLEDIINEAPTTINNIIMEAGGLTAWLVISDSKSCNFSINTGTNIIRLRNMSKFNECESSYQNLMPPNDQQLRLANSTSPFRSISSQHQTVEDCTDDPHLMMAIKESLKEDYSSISYDAISEDEQLRLVLAQSCIDAKEDERRRRYCREFGNPFALAKLREGTENQPVKMAGYIKIFDLNTNELQLIIDIEGFNVILRGDAPIEHYKDGEMLGVGDFVCAYVVHVPLQQSVSFNRLTERFEAIRMELIQKADSTLVFETDSTKDCTWQNLSDQQLIDKFYDDAIQKPDNNINKETTSTATSVSYNNHDRAWIKTEILGKVVVCKKDFFCIVKKCAGAKESDKIITIPLRKEITIFTNENELRLGTLVKIEKWTNKKDTEEERVTHYVTIIN